MEVRVGSSIIWQGNCMEVLRGIPAMSVDLVFTSPPYFAQREYGDDHDEIGRETDPQVYLTTLVDFVALCAMAIREDGHVLINLGDKYNADGVVKSVDAKAGTFRGARRQPTWKGMSLKSLMLLPHRLAVACADQLGLAVRGEIIWVQDAEGADGKATDRVRRAHETIYHFTKRRRHGQANGVWESPGHSVWSIPVTLDDSHPADFPPGLADRIVRCWSPPGGTVLDPFMGSGTVGVSCVLLGRKFLGIELYPSWFATAKQRITTATNSIRGSQAYLWDG